MKVAKQKSDYISTRRNGVYIHSGMLAAPEFQVSKSEAETYIEHEAIKARQPTSRGPVISGDADADLFFSFRY
jgi:hypothetical protein